MSIGSGSTSPAEKKTQIDDECWNAGRVEIRGWVRQSAPSLAELYKGAVHLFLSPEHSRPKDPAATYAAVNFTAFFPQLSEEIFGQLRRDSVSRPCAVFRCC